MCMARVWHAQVLGLGDVVVPGAFVSLLRQADLDGLDDAGAPWAGRKLQRAAARRAALLGGGRGLESFPYFYNGLGGYAAGLLVTFAANYLTQSGQPALVYIVPSLLLTAAATAASRGELQPLLRYTSARAAAAKAAQEAAFAERDRARAEEKGRKAKGRKK